MNNEAYKTIKKKYRKVANNYWRFSVHTVKEILGHIASGQEQAWLNGFPVGLTSVRLRTYLKGTECVHCGLRASFFAVEVNTGSPHLNLYGLNDRGHAVMMTSDHIVPKSRGGDKNDVANRQCLCTKCNGKKSNRLEHELTGGIAA